jgi:uncharacterized protein (DUF362 family)
MVPRCQFTRRSMLQLTAWAPALRPLLAQTKAAAEPRSTVSLVKGDSRRKNIAAALEAIDEQIRPALKAKRYVIIKPNFVSTTNQLAATHAEALHGILDYLEPRFKGPVIVAEASAGDTMNGFDQFAFNRVATERRSQHVQLIDLNREAKYVTIPLINYDLHATPTRLAARLMDPEAFVICAAVLKTHNAMVATLSVKNMALGAPLHSVPGETPRWNDKRVTHNGLRQTHYNIFLTAQAMKPFWGAAVIDGFEGMEGNGPASGTPVDSRLAIASRDFVAADRVGVEAMGIDAKWPGYLRFCSDFGVGQYDLAKIDIRGEKLQAVQRKYQLHQDIERQLEWMGPMKELPPKVG